MKKENPIIRYVRETRAEIGKVTWPTRKESINLTIVVLVTVIAMSIFLGLFDALFSWIFTQLIHLI